VTKEEVDRMIVSKSGLAVALLTLGDLLGAGSFAFFGRHA